MASSSIPVADQREAMAQDRDTAREVALEADLSDPARVVDAPISSLVYSNWLPADVRNWAGSSV
ncbi:hypothetical protein [Aeromicrobium duanguangcaii]|uniref:hypothetical protein n=1 Tax=Aeromicrobium duanguangcaii TaxID=2968086 RepID=UPI0020171CA8|nr:hypothetical protein [Aeromicrobium duanguangcaii]MCL3836673.1 hypothetical protein [Aeromicrobium duanguangcaii]